MIVGDIANAPRYLKNVLNSHHPSIVYVPDRFLVVVFSAIFAWLFDWKSQGLEILGHIRSSDLPTIPFHWPFQFQHINNVGSLVSTSFMIALIGLFESLLTAKSIRRTAQKSELEGFHVNTDQELIALGASNVVGGCFMALPAFGGYGRSKLNVATGATSPMSSVLLSLITVVCVVFLLPAFYYVPRGVLAAMISAVGVSMVEECPHDVHFFAKIRGWQELSLMAVVFGATVLHSIQLGMAIGITLSLLLLIQHSTQSTVRIQDPVSEAAHSELSRLADLCPKRAMVFKLTGPLTFANTSNFKDSLAILEQKHTMSDQSSNPAVVEPRKTPDRGTVIFAISGSASIDNCAAQVFLEVVEDYVREGTRVIFCCPFQADCESDILQKLTLSGIVDLCGGKIVTSFEETVAILDQDVEQYIEQHTEQHTEQYTGGFMEDSEV